MISGQRYRCDSDRMLDDNLFVEKNPMLVLIEVDHQRRVAPFRSREPSRDHIHAVLRTPNGNDYGKELLRQHIEQHHHGR